MQDFIYKPLTEKDFPLLSQWFNKPHIEKFWQGPKTLAALRKKYLHHIASDFIFPFMVYLDENPIGFIQYYFANQMPEWPEEANETVGIDQFIGDERYLNKGYGTNFIAIFIQQLFLQPAIKKIIVDPSIQNEIAIRCYEKIGFQKTEEIYRAEEKVVIVMQLTKPKILIDTPLLLKKTEKELQTKIGKAIFNAICSSLTLGNLKNKPTDKQLVIAYQRLISKWNILALNDRKVILNFLLDQTLLTPEQRQLIEESFGADVTINGNTAVVAAPRKPGGILELRLMVGIGGKYNPQGVALQRDMPGAKNLLEKFEETQDRKLEENKQGDDLKEYSEGETFSEEEIKSPSKMKQKVSMFF